MNYTVLFVMLALLVLCIVIFLFLVRTGPPTPKGKDNLIDTIRFRFAPFVDRSVKLLSGAGLFSAKLVKRHQEERNYDDAEQLRKYEQPFTNYNELPRAYNREPLTDHNEYPEKYH